MNKLKNIGFGLAALATAYCGGCSSGDSEQQKNFNPHSMYDQISSHVDTLYGGRYSDGKIVNVSITGLKGKGLDSIFEKHDEIFNITGTNLLIGVNYEENSKPEFKQYFVSTKVDSLKYGEHNH
ncbi:hypothetical protein HN865_00610 [Candidatus Woesearchaeota archaeon]|jgi:hypothetical protein|nr:hypothetical protein [Candidatus Woesearchaeota archaeon]MBT7237341.1 hypothetical protein [Candidatus Woesearchaeota archaeon]